MQAMTDASTGGEALVRLEVEGARATVTLDSQHNRNALSRRLVTELFAALEAAEADADVRVVALLAAGPVFCSGADLSEATAEGMEEGARRIVELQRYIATMSKPVVTRVHGAVRAGGIGIVAASDVAIAQENATFALTEVKLGLAAAIISLTVHARMNPRAAALTTLGGEVFSGAEAAAYGLVTEAVPAVALSARVAEVCAQLATGSPQGLRESKAILNRDLVARIDAHGEEMAALSARLFASDAAREAMNAFLNRRK
jgi:enoyl-CoA hydratase/methylglutaconyl-CoA hydratase